MESLTFQSPTRTALRMIGDVRELDSPYYGDDKDDRKNACESPGFCEENGLLIRGQRQSLHIWDFWPWLKSEIVKTMGSVVVLEVIAVGRRRTRSSSTLGRYGCLCYCMGTRRSFLTKNLSKFLPGRFKNNEAMCQTRSDCGSEHSCVCF